MIGQERKDETGQQMTEHERKDRRLDSRQADRTKQTAHHSKHKRVERVDDGQEEGKRDWTAEKTRRREGWWDLPLQGSFFTRNSSRATQPPPTRTITVLRRIRTRRNFCESPNCSTAQTYIGLQHCLISYFAMTASVMNRLAGTGAFSNIQIPKSQEVGGERELKSNATLITTRMIFWHQHGQCCEPF